MTTLDSNALITNNPNAVYTVSGQIVTPLSPDPSTIKVEDIAHSLSNQCRFTGHTRYFYSTAEHVVMVTEMVRALGGTRDEQAWALLHDGTEFVLSDIARPLKHYNEFGNLYREIEDELMRAIAEAEMLGPTMPTIVKKADDLALRIEIRDLMPPILEEVYRDDEAYKLWPHTIRPLGPHGARRRFMDEYNRINQAN